ncbi:hypothetical protein [Sphingomonas aerophila]|uniref:Threonine/homoserine/homoserine lactone efflux protein n=1 Tax=Sphingomonas aerophila TaxID=1344948 RepID=A0A7W9BDI5_9SPHN|nr:hypothetical protein [Sphingomonas aerophila]MBB5715255.1 threonine/homoserine/homoserine lactone efflux protein [Sphingomonas aerophila]
MPGAFWGAGGSVLIALVAAAAERRRQRRRDPDRVGWVDWRAVQLFGLVGALILVSVALNG